MIEVRKNMRLAYILLMSCILMAVTGCSSISPSLFHKPSQAKTNALTIQETEHIQALRQKLRPDKTGSCIKARESNRSVLIFAGETDYTLINCLNQGMGERHVVLRITSLGGNTDVASMAALYIRHHDMSVEVDGVCFSSCANYIAPAAQQLTVLPLSFLGLHGAPELYSEAAARRLEAETRADPNIPSERVEGYVKGMIAMLHRTSAHQIMIQKVLSVGSEWYWLENISQATRGSRIAEDRLWVPDKAMIRQCLKGIKSLQMWEATQDFEKAVLKMIAPNAGEVFFVSLPQGNDCFGPT